jgi:geranylgeranyl diphosphate synthase type II
MDIKEELRKKKEAVERELERLLPPGKTRLSEAMRYAVLSGGKRYRPLLVLSSAESFGAEMEAVLPFACAVEFIHNYSLVHDDLPCMDDDDLRRGQLTCHKAFGQDIALLAGDGLLTLAFEVLARSPLAKELEPRRERIIQEVSFSAGMEGMIGGQLLDITISPGEVSAEQMEELMQKKTGALIVASVRIGAILGKAPESLLEAVTEYGRNVGLAFQTRDDILDSAEDAGAGRQMRPNSVSVFGLPESKLRLERFVRDGLGNLEKAGIESEGLRFLATRLLDVKDE